MTGHPWRAPLAVLLCAPLVATALAACSDEGTTAVGVAPTAAPMPAAAAKPGDLDSEKAALALARRTWAGRGGADYDLVVAGSCFCVDTGIVTIQVRAGSPSVTKVEPGYPSGPTPTSTPERLATTVEALQDLVAAELASSEKVTVTYSPDGVPTRIDADRMLDAVDDEMTWTIGYTAR